MRFEPLKYEHLQQMAEIEREAFDMPWNEAMFIPEITRDDAVYRVGVRGDEVICYGGFHKVLDEGHITNIAVKSSERGRGFGKFLMSTLIEEARQRGVAHLTLEVRYNNERAIKLYESFGFKTAGIRKKYYNNRDDALIMWLDI
ncbi:MAG: ribosomal protein S18-alanine N-acetyltransferase [Clostridia bacterium]|nr:ribosomal protein S18-alanine N-acetyltransferase [Clostridia bacterium]